MSIEASAVKSAWKNTKRIKKSDATWYHAVCVVAGKTLEETAPTLIRALSGLCKGAKPSEYAEPGIYGCFYGTSTKPGFLNQFYKYVDEGRFTDEDEWIVSVASFFGETVESALEYWAKVRQCVCSFCFAHRNGLGEERQKETTKPRERCHHQQQSAQKGSWGKGYQTSACSASTRTALGAATPTPAYG